MDFCIIHENQRDKEFIFKFFTMKLDSDLELKNDGKEHLKANKGRISFIN